MAGIIHALENPSIDQSIAMEAEHLNALSAKLADLKARSEDLRRYL